MSFDPIKKIIEQMTPDQKVGAVITFGLSGTSIKKSTIEAIEKYHCGGIRPTPFCRTWYSYVHPHSKKKVVHIEDQSGTKTNVAPPYCPAEQYAELLTELQRIAASRPLGLGLHISFDQEGGSSADFRMGGVNIFPKPMGIRATGDSKYAYKVALAVAKQAKAAGLNWIHSPVLDINTNHDNPEISTRSYSDQVDEIIEYAEQSLRGFKDGGVISTAKHFPGRGDSGHDTHFDVSKLEVSKSLMDKRELFPYEVLISKGLLPTIMLGHTIYPSLDEGVIATISKKIIQDILRDELGFTGVITTDSMTMAGIASRYNVDEACAKALQAGADIVLMKAGNHLQGDVFEMIKRYIDEGKISEEELDRKIYRILSLKDEYNILCRNSSDLGNDAENVTKVLRDPQIIELSREVALKSVLISRDRESLLPLPKNKKILVIEQGLEKTPNDVWWHSGMLFEFCQCYNSEIDFLEIGFMADEEDFQRIEARIDDYDYVIITNFFLRSKIPNNDLVKHVFKLCKNVILVNNTPYKMNTPDIVGTVITTFATSPRNLEVTAGVIFGEIDPEGNCPKKDKGSIEKQTGIFDNIEILEKIN